VSLQKLQLSTDITKKSSIFSSLKKVSLEEVKLSATDSPLLAFFNFKSYYFVTLWNCFNCPTLLQRTIYWQSLYSSSS